MNLKAKVKKSVLTRSTDSKVKSLAGMTVEILPNSAKSIADSDCCFVDVIPPNNHRFMALKIPKITIGLAFLEPMSEETKFFFKSKSKSI